MTRYVLECHTALEPVILIIEAEATLFGSHFICHILGGYLLWKKSESATEGLQSIHRFVVGSAIHDADVFGVSSKRTTHQNEELARFRTRYPTDERLALPSLSSNKG